MSVRRHQQLSYSLVFCFIHVQRLHHDIRPPAPPSLSSIAHLFIQLPLIHLSTDSSTHPLSSHPSSHVSSHPSIHPPTHPSIHPSIRLPIHPSVRPSICPPTHPSTHSLIRHLSTQPIRPSIRPSVHLPIYLIFPCQPSLHALVKPLLQKSSRVRSMKPRNLLV